MPRPGNSWACSANIFTLLAGKPCPGCTNPLFFLPLLDYCACVWDPHHTTCINKLKVIQEFAAKLATGLWFPGCQDPIQIMNWPPLLHAENGKSCCCANIFCLVVQSYHPQYSLLTPTLLPGSVNVWHYIVLSQKRLPIFTPSSQVLSHYGTSCHHDLIDISARSQAMLKRHLNQVVL